MKKILALLGVISVLALTGCGKVDNAATIGDITITQAAAQATIDEVLAERAKVDSSQMQVQTGAELKRSQLRFTIITTIFDHIAKELKITISNTELENSKAELITNSGGQEALATNLVAAQIAPSNFDRYVRAVLISSKIKEGLIATGTSEEDVDMKISQLISAKAAELKVTVSPRFGKWDEESGDVVAMDSAGSAVVPSGN